MTNRFNVLLYTLGNVAVSNNTILYYPNKLADPFCYNRSQELYNAMNQKYNISSWACGRYGQRTYSKELGIEWALRMSEFLDENIVNKIPIDFSIQMAGHPTMVQPFPYFIITDFLPYDRYGSISILDSKENYTVKKDCVHEQDALYQNATGVICYSPLSSHAVQSYHGVDACRVTTICSGVIGHVDKDYIKKPDKILLWVGSDFIHKGGPELLLAYEMIRKYDSQYQLYLVGIDEQVNLPGVITLPFLHGQSLSILDDLYKRAQLLILPSWQENLGFVYLEAMARKTPIIATTRGGMANYVRRNKCGKLVAPGQPLQLFDIIMSVLSDPTEYRRLSENAYSFSVLNSRWDIFMDRLDDAIVKWLSGRDAEVPSDYNQYLT